MFLRLAEINDLSSSCSCRYPPFTSWTEYILPPAISQPSSYNSVHEIMLSFHEFIHINWLFENPDFASTCERGNPFSGLFSLNDVAIFFHFTYFLSAAGCLSTGRTIPFSYGCVLMVPFPGGDPVLCNAPRKSLPSAFGECLYSIRVVAQRFRSGFPVPCAQIQRCYHGCCSGLLNGRL